MLPAGFSDDVAAEALLETGNDALPELRRLLDNGDPARLFGSMESTASIGYKYRRKDYAYHYACSILGLPYKFDQDPRGTDKDIEVLKAKLDKLLGERAK